jgi:hypothetical protein
MARSNFSPTGLNIGENNANMAYLYGISDFFSIMFEDTSKTNLLLEAGAEGASEVYSRFLQLTSTISLDDIQSTLGQTLKLVTIKNTDAVAGEVNVYALPETIVSTRYIANRPLLPTVLFENDVDYRIEKSEDGTMLVRFAKDISNVGFPTRLLSDETTKEYALWFVDAEIDESWISDYFGSLIGIDPQASTDAFKNFVYGLYYVYIHGPTLELLRKGLNLCLGVPLCRGNEIVLDIRRYPETDQWIVITDQNQYLLPFGLDPIVVVDDTMKAGDELAQWVEVKDYIRDGDWWINLLIPSKLIPEMPEGQKDRYATKGSHFDYLMRQYLKKHTFLVNVKVQDFKNNQVFAQLADIINRAKPSYTEAVYIWTIPKLDEVVTVEETLFVQRRDQSRCENVTQAIEKMHRGNNVDALLRGCPTFIRYNVPHWVSKQSGFNEYVNGGDIPFESGTATGFVNHMAQYRPNTVVEKAWLRAINERGSEASKISRSKIGFSRGVHNLSDAAVNHAGIPVHTIHKMAKVPSVMKIIPLYTTTQADLKNKCDVAGIRTPDLVEWTFDLMNPNTISEEINKLSINEGLPDITYSLLIQNYETFRSRGTDVHYLSNIIPELGLQSTNISSLDITTQDYLIGVRIYDAVVGIYLVTENTNIVVPPFYVVEENDSLEMTVTNRPTRGLGPTGSSYYLTRGRGVLDYNTVRTTINDGTINDADTLNNSTVIVPFSDSRNSLMQITRGGAPIVHLMEVK